MKIPSLPALPVSVFIVWIATCPLSFAVPPRFPASVITRTVVPAHNASIQGDVGHVPLFHAHLGRRGCISSRPADSDPESDTDPDPASPGADPTAGWTCDGNIPSVEEIVEQIQLKGDLGTKISAFYTELHGVRALDTSKTWMNQHTDLIPCTPGYVMFDEIVDNTWYLAVVGALVRANDGARIDRFQKYLSQLMAEKTKGTAWIFAPVESDFANPNEDSTWAHWEFPALTQNPDVTEVIRTDPRDFQDPPSLTTIWRQGDPTQVPRGLNF
ncbi:hypothetical protein T440DRAFT_479296 [Plenodomus tracheiphilus IPT5]|uniref:Uncharacterized protein n=1 Tax=Plenodomus tracheiphilus IPT5 TaxID=1408161 RepID=A0A6A7B511_9PLEO|nr:hypothetical protein T440DRAFT_479296 [Plenodomus tracheiphilus IPT5]